MLEIKSNSTILLQFFLNISLNSANSVTKIFVITVIGLESATSCVRRPECHHSVSKTHVRYRIFKFSPIHLSDSLHSMNTMKFLLHLGKPPLSRKFSQKYMFFLLRPHQEYWRMIMKESIKNINSLCIFIFITKTMQDTFSLIVQIYTQVVHNSKNFFYSYWRNKTMVGTFSFTSMWT